MLITNKTLSDIETKFNENFTTHGEIGASLSIWQHGEELFNIAHGLQEKEQETPWTSDTLITVYSATKGIAAATLLLMLEKQKLTPETTVCSIWKNFPIKEATIAQVMSHQCGLPILTKKVSVFDYQAVIEAIESQTPSWQLGNQHGYHPRTYGFILDEICRQLTGEKIAKCYNQYIQIPLGLEFWIGLPEDQHHRVAKLYSGKMKKADLESGFYKQFNTVNSLVHKAFLSPIGLQAVSEMNSAKAWQCELPALGGIGTAQSLAKFYQAAIGEISFFSPQVMQWMQSLQYSGEDKILCAPTAFSCGFQLDPVDSFGRKLRAHYGISANAFGHPGAGGSHAFGDPDNGISFAYTMNQMELSVLTNRKCTAIIDTLYHL